MNLERHGPSAFWRAGSPRRALSIAFAALRAVSTAAEAATIYRWVDERGRVHYSHVVPERFRSTAKPVAIPNDTPDPEQQRQARERAEAAQARAASSADEQAVRPAPPITASPAAPRPVGKRPATVPDEGTDCETWQRLYRESLECFGPYRTVRGATRAEGFAVCNEVLEPPRDRCRLRIP